MGPKKVCILGLGHFGLSLSLQLSEAGAEVIAIDNRQEVIDDISSKVTHAVCCDSTDRKTLERLGIQDVDFAIVSIGEDFESSLLTTAILQEIGIKQIFSRVITPIHEKILMLMDIKNLLYPEDEAAVQLVRRLLLPGLIESFEISKDYGIFEIETPKEFINKKLIEINLRQNYLLNLVTIKRNIKTKTLKGETIEPVVIGVPLPEIMLLEGDYLVLFGKEKDIRKLLLQ